MRARRPEDKQTCCIENIQAWLGSLGLPSLNPLAVRVDRVFFGRDDLFLRSMESDPRFEKWNAVGKHGVTAIRGWRERRAWCSAQVIEHKGAVEIDFDLCNPNHGALPALGHLFEVAWPGRTDPFRVRRALARRGIEVVHRRHESVAEAVGLKE